METPTLAAHGSLTLKNVNFFNGGSGKGVLPMSVGVSGSRLSRLGMKMRSVSALQIQLGTNERSRQAGDAGVISGFGIHRVEGVTMTAV